MGEVVLESGNIFRHCHPHLVDVNAKVFVNERVSHTSHLLPGNILVAISQIAGKLLDGFTDDLELSNNCILNESILEESLFVQSPYVFLDRIDRINDMLHVHFVVTPHKSPDVR